MEPTRTRSAMDVLVRVLAIFGALVLVTILSLVVIGIALRSRPRIPSRTVLEIDFGRGLEETSPSGVGRFYRGEALRIRDVVSALDFAAQDNRVRGIVARIAGGPFSFADVQEVRNAIGRFRASGKPAIAFSESFGEFGPGTSSYYLASAFDSVYLQPSGDLGVTGILSETAFLRGTLEKLDVKPQLGAREEYKTARNMFTESSFTDAHREVNQSIITSILERVITDVASSRSMEKERVRTLFSQGPYTAGQAQAAGLVDGLEYRDGVYERIRQRAGGNVRLLYLTRYIRRIRPSPSRGRGIALIYGNGTIVRGRSRYNPMSGEWVMGSETVAAALRAAVRDRNIGAIVFRINSPGGSYIASDVIWREAVRAREAGKPVIVTMGAVAGSGGYFVAMNANRIIAQPSTITGSIGVVAGKFASEGLFNRFGITFDRVATSPNATIWSPTQEYSSEQWNQIQSLLDTIYTDFVNKVAQGRNLSEQRAREIARGRIYTGDEALQLGLVDTLGGFPEAFASAKRLMGVPVDRPVRVSIFPRPRTIWEQILGPGPESSEDVNVESTDMAGLLLELPASAGMIDRLLNRGTLSMDHFEIR